LRGAAGVYDFFEPLVMCLRHRRLNGEVARAAGACDGERVLDIGCGTGRVSQAVARTIASGEVVGIDASTSMIRVAERKRASRVCRFEAALAERLPYEAASFDAAVSSLFFHHVPADLKRRAAEEMVRVLKPGGRIAVADIDRPWTVFGHVYGAAGWILLRQPEIKENLDGMLPGVLCQAGVADLKAVYGTLGCIRVWTGRKRE
jgi:ubiquinone/menaquinone biosynthesis C-methylase UbiE